MVYRLANVSSATIQKQARAFFITRLNVVQHLRDAMADSQEKQEEQAYAKDIICIESYEVGQ